MINQIAHVCISSSDLDKTRHFYCEGLGFRKVFDFVRDGEVVGHYFGVTDNTFIEVFIQNEIDTQVTAPVRHFCLEVDSIDDVRALLAPKGYEVSERKLGRDGSYQAWVTDPSGVRIEFHEYTDMSLQITGGVCDVSR